MSSFLNTEKNELLSNLVEGYKERLDNPYYTNMDKKLTIVTYYNQNEIKTTLDPGSKLSYATIGKNSSLKLNKINNFYLGGIDRLEVSLQNEEYGLESDPIEGNAIVLPNTIVPIPNDYFTINYLNKNIVFKVNEVNKNTLESGGNVYNISYRLDQDSPAYLDSQVVEEYNMIVTNNGTQFNTIIKNSDYDFISLLEDITSKLKQYYKELFYSDRVQCFVFMMNEHHFYDPYLTEFIIRNNIVNDNDEYLYITHQTQIPNTFAIDYDRTFFRAIELQEYSNRYKADSTASLIDDPTSLLSSRLEDYYEIDYIRKLPMLTIIENISPTIINAIISKTLIRDNDYRNIIVNYFLQRDITKSDIDLIDNISFDDNIDLFYNVPIIIYILEKNIVKLLTKQTYK